jgi:hypothetical protein
MVCRGYAAVPRSCSSKHYGAAADTLRLLSGAAAGLTPVHGMQGGDVIKGCHAYWFNTVLLVGTEDLQLPALVLCSMYEAPLTIV